MIQRVREERKGWSQKSSRGEREREKEGEREGESINGGVKSVKQEGEAESGRKKRIITPSPLSSTGLKA